MEIFDIDSCLKSMSIIVDTREQPSPRAHRRYKSFECPYRIQKIEHGDYTYNFMLPDGNELYKPDDIVIPKVVIERKADLIELSGNFCEKPISVDKQMEVRNRFEREFKQMAADGTKAYLLVEDSCLEDIYRGNYNTKYNSNAFIASVMALMARYNISPLFCSQRISGRVIHDVLYRELKERLKRGEYDAEGV